MTKADTQQRGDNRKKMDTPVSFLSQLIQKKKSVKTVQQHKFYSEELKQETVRLLTPESYTWA